jgi:lipopolysaccharide/colanic/teichoic acid biosynthesis glycosyltransferase
MGRSYTLYKLRTMKKDAEKTGAEWAREKDQRVTRCGKYLRKWRIDEIPQFWNVIKGEMSIVGPRPERPEFQDELIDKVPHWNCRHLVKPGLTGWAQIRFRYASDVDASEEKLAFDLYYIKNASIMMDLQIILSTLRFIARGSR